MVLLDRGLFFARPHADVPGGQRGARRTAPLRVPPGEPGISPGERDARVFRHPPGGGPPGARAPELDAAPGAVHRPPGGAHLPRPPHPDRGGGLHHEPLRGAGGDVLPGRVLLVSNRGRCAPGPAGGGSPGGGGGHPGAVYRRVQRQTDRGHPSGPAGAVLCLRVRAAVPTPPLSPEMEMGARGMRAARPGRPPGQTADRRIVPRGPVETRRDGGPAQLHAQPAAGHRLLLPQDPPLAGEPEHRSRHPRDHLRLEPAFSGGGTPSGRGGGAGGAGETHAAVFLFHRLVPGGPVAVVLDRHPARPGGGTPGVPGGDRIFRPVRRAPGAGRAPGGRLRPHRADGRHPRGGGSAGRRPQPPDHAPEQHLDERPRPLAGYREQVAPPRAAAHQPGARVQPARRGRPVDRALRAVAGDGRRPVRAALQPGRALPQKRPGG